MGYHAGAWEPEKKLDANFMTVEPETKAQMLAP